MNRFEQLQALVASMQEDFDKFYNKSNKAAGTRVRSHMQEIRKFGAEVRTEVQNMKNQEKA